MKPRTYLTPEQVEWAIEQRKKKVPLKAIAEELRVGPSRLLDYLPKELHSHLRRRRFTPKEQEAIERAYLYEPGMSLRAIGVRHDACYNSIRKVLIARGVTLRKKGQSLAANGEIKSGGYQPAREPDANAPIGQAPKFREVDAAILRARLEAGLIDGRRRRSRFRAVEWSSLAWVE